jgi:hypothetical protein
MSSKKREDDKYKYRQRWLGEKGKHGMQENCVINTRIP